MENKNMTDKVIKNIILRIERLEKAVFSAKDRSLSQLKSPRFDGPKGGTLLLISRGYFNTRKTTSEVEKELKKNGYDYRRDVVRTALNRLSKNNGPLTAFKDGGQKVYVKRK